MFQKNILQKKEGLKPPMKPYSRAYMSSYEWTYRVLDIVDYIEYGLPSKKENDSKWKLLKEYCAQYDLNWIVIKKMIEYTVAEKFDNEAELLKCEDFKPLELRKDIIDEKNHGKEEKVLTCIDLGDF